MRIVAAGATGFLGQPLVRHLADQGHHLVVLSRRPPPPAAPRAVEWRQWTPDGSVGHWATALEGADALVNLAGASIAARRWTAAQKRRIRDSRVLATRSLVGAIAGAARPPALLVNGSAVGYYGARGDEPIDETEPPGRDFLGQVCEMWEAEAGRAASSHTRVVCIRTGLVLERDGGALSKMLPPFWLGLGGPVGSGRQYWPWIHRKDWINLILFALTAPALAGALNATAPNPVTNAEFARALGRALRRPALIPAPGVALKLVLGEMAQALLLTGQRALPARAERLGFRFEFPTIEGALAAIFLRSPG